MLPLETFHSHHKRERALRRMVSPQDRTTRICISLATSDPLPDHRSSTQTFSGLQIIFTLPENLAFKVSGLRNTWKVSCSLIGLYLIPKSIDFSKSHPTPTQYLHTFNKTGYYCLSYWVTLSPPNMDWAMHLSNPNLWKDALLGHNYFLCFKLQLIPCAEL